MPAVTIREREAYLAGRESTTEANPFEGTDDLQVAWSVGRADAAASTPPSPHYCDLDSGPIRAGAEGVVPLNAACIPPQSKSWTCHACKLFQYSPTFNAKDRETYEATLDPDRRLKKNNRYQVESSGPETAEVLVLLDNPGSDADSKGYAAGGHLLTIQSYALKADIDPTNWRYTYVNRCHAPLDAAPTFLTSVYCTRFLSEEIRLVKPRIILALGAVPLQVLLGKPGASIMEFHGIPQHVTVAGHECDVFPLWSPGYVSRNDYLADRYLAAFDKFAKFLTGAVVVATDVSDYGIIRTPDAAIAACRQIIEGVERRIIDIDTETSGINPYKVGARLCIISIADSLRRGFAIPFNHDDAPWTDADRRRVIDEGLRPLLTHPAVRLRLHNGKFDYKWLSHHLGFWPRDIVEDTMLTHYGVDENMEHGLKPLALRYTDMGDYDHVLDQYLKANTKPGDDPRYDKVPLDIIGRYAAQDPVATRKLARTLAPVVDEQGPEITALVYRALPAFSATLTRLEVNGVSIDLPFARSQVPALQGEVNKAYAAIFSEPVVRRFIRDQEAVARAKMKKPKPIEEKRYFEFKLGSPNQLKTLIYDPNYYGHEARVFSDSGAPSTDKEAMAQLVKENSPIAKRIVDYRLEYSLLNTFVLPIISRCDEQQDNVLHGNFLLHGTVTGRLASRDPNLQNVPNKGASIIKRMYVSRYGDEGCLVQADYSQIELRILAAIAHDEGMIRAYEQGQDLHEITACLIFNMTPAEFKALPKDESKRRRTIAKRINFGIPYGVGGDGISNMLRGEGIEIDIETCRGYIDTFFEKKPAVKAWIDAVIASTDLDAISSSLFGRRRRLEQVRSVVDDVRAGAHRQSVNHPIQSTASDMTITTLCLVDNEIMLRRGGDRHLIHPTIDAREFPVDPAWSRVHPVLTVHDSIVIDCHRSMAERVVKMVRRIMPNVVDYAHIVWGPQIHDTLDILKTVPIEADIEVGPNWRDAHKIKKASDTALALYIADQKRSRFDVDPHFKWTDDIEKAVIATYSGAA